MGSDLKLVLVFSILLNGYLLFSLVDQAVTLDYVKDSLVLVFEDRDAAIAVCNSALTDSERKALLSAMRGLGIRVRENGRVLTVTNKSWNGIIDPGESETFGLEGEHGGTFTDPTCVSVP